MARKRPKQPLEWNEVRDDDGSVLGWYAIHEGMVTARYPGGGEKTTHIGNPQAVQGLARLMLGESPPR